VSRLGDLACPSAASGSLLLRVALKNNEQLLLDMGAAVVKCARDLQLDFGTNGFREIGLSRQGGSAGELEFTDVLIVRVLQDANRVQVAQVAKRHG